MVSLIALAVLAQDNGVNVYTSPPLDWLHGQRIRWILSPTCLIVTSKANKEAFQKRFVEFKLQDTSKSMGPGDFSGQFNFWSQPRLKSLGLLTDATMQKLQHHEVAVLHESGYMSCLVPLKGSDYLLYVQITKPAHLPKSKEDRIRRTFATIAVR